MYCYRPCLSYIFQELNPVVAAVDLSPGQPRSRFVSWSSSTDHRSRRNGRTSSVDRYGPSHIVPVSCVNEFSSSNQSLLTDSSTGRQMVVLGRSGNRTPSAESCGARQSPVCRGYGSDIETSRDVETSRELHNDNREPGFATSGAEDGTVICIAPCSQVGLRWMPFSWDFLYCNISMRLDIIIFFLVREAFQLVYINKIALLLVDLVWFSMWLLFNVFVSSSSSSAPYSSFNFRPLLFFPLLLLRHLLCHLLLLGDIIIILAL